MPFRSDDYMQRMHPHSFGDSNFIIEYARETFRDEQPGFAPGGVKLVHVVRRRPDLPVGRVRAGVGRAACPRPAHRRRDAARAGWCRASTRRSTGPTLQGTLFELAGVGGYAGVEELWFDDLDALLRFTEDGAVRGAVLGGGLAGGSGAGASRWSTPSAWSTTTRWGARAVRRPPCSIPSSLEARVDAQKYAGWNVPGWEQRAKGQV